MIKLRGWQNGVEWVKRQAVANGMAAGSASVFVLYSTYSTVQCVNEQMKKGLFESTNEK